MAACGLCAADHFHCISRDLVSSDVYDIFLGSDFEGMLTISALVAVLCGLAMLVSRRGRWSILAAIQIAASVTFAISVAYRATKHDLPPLGLIWLLAILLWGSMMICFRQRRTPPGFCVQCGYNLTGNVSGVCPECGSPIIPEPPVDP